VAACGRTFGSEVGVSEPACVGVGSTIAPFAPSVRERVPLTLAAMFVNSENSISFRDQTLLAADSKTQAVSFY
jgi:hypothetical protein